MKFVKKIKAWWRGFFRKRRFNMLNATDNTEEWHMHISPASLFAALVSFVLLMFIVVLSLVAYSPVLEFLPGYRTEIDRSRESLVHNIIRLDSMERMMNDMLTYNQNISLIMEGKTPVARMFTSSDSTRSTKVLVMPSHEDSILRSQMEGDGEYALSGRSGTSRRSVREAIQLVTPAQGIITDRFDIKNGNYNISMAVAASEPIAAIDKGTVILTRWSPETGYIILIEHTGNLIAIYRGLSQSLVTKGQTIRPGELVGYSAEAQGGDVRLFEFELWDNGKLVDPEEYIVF
ncbi:M23 family metallopeptidase [uncultured Alistipes sp.]|jgi:membrane-bound metallopeptidase|uniref:murein hydrolase activator EnvC family protein n=1 Tax=uncultured Alistipes sp. TaxID=538949 RepID=UPI0025DC1150|nr:M23 family metallopeptidase [uncultured Alistipes sp.]